MNDQQITERRQEILQWLAQDQRLFPSGVVCGLAHELACDERVTMPWLKRQAKRLEGKPRAGPYWRSALLGAMSKLPAPKVEKPAASPEAVRAWLQQPRTRGELQVALSRCPHDHEARPDLERAYAEVM